jgi:hypothetical protein
MRLPLKPVLPGLSYPLIAYNISYFPSGGKNLVSFYKTDFARIEAMSSTSRFSVSFTLALDELKLIIQKEHAVANLLT